MKNRDTVSFEVDGRGEQGMAEATHALKELCNDGRVWVVSTVFGCVRCTAFSSARIPIDYIEGRDFLGTHYWQNGSWHKIDQARLDRAEEKAWEASFTADR